MRLSGQGLDPIGDLLSRLAKLRDDPVGRVSLGDVVGPRWLTSRLVNEGGSISSRSATVMKLVRNPWNQNSAPPASPMRGKPCIRLSHRAITLTVHPGSNGAKCAAVVHEWHKSILHEAVQELIVRWESKLDVNVSGYFLQRMKTKWGAVILPPTPLGSTRNS